MPSPRAPMLFRLALALVLTGLTACSPTWVQPADQQPERFATWVDAAPSQYLIQPGDGISVTLPFNSELNRNGTVAPDGTFTMPLAGTFPAAGYSPEQLADRIDKMLTANGIVANARASVSVQQYAGVVYVAGQVLLPSAVPLHANMTALQAITEARGMLDTARTNEVVLIRRSPTDGRPMLRTIDIDELTHKGDPSQAVVLQPFDTVYVPKSSVAEVDQWVDQHINQAIPFSKGLSYTYTNSTTTTP